MNTIFSRLVFFLFLLVPIVFIGTDYPTILAPFVMPGYHYESVKVLVFFLLGALLCIVSLFSWWKKDTAHPLSHTAILGIVLLVASIVLSTVLSDFPTEALGGSSEKRHGAILYGSLVLLYLLLRYRMSPEIRTMGKAGIFTGFAIVAGYALVQVCRLYLLPSWEVLSDTDLMISSTMGNSAYLAGYALVLLPWILQEERSRLFQYILGILAIMVIFTTGSLSAIILATIYLFSVGFKEYKKSRTEGKSIQLLRSPLFLLPLMVFLWGIIFFSLTHFSLDMKIQNFETRLVLWHETLNLWKHDPVSMVFGNGADTLGRLLELERSAELRTYIPDIFYIDRAHNIFLDILFSFGIMGLLAFLVPLWTLLRNRLHHPSTHVALLFFAFFFFNIPVISHWLVLVFALSTIKKKG